MGKIYGIVFKDGRTATANSWPECEAQTKGVSGVRFKAFESKAALDSWVKSQVNTASIGIDEVAHDNSKDALYVDGSYSKHGLGYAGWAYVHMRGDTPVYIQHGATPEKATSRNIDGEMFATYKALKYMQENMEPTQVYLVHDYLGISQWLLHLWKDKKGTNYVRDCKYLYDDLIKKGFNITFIHIKGHKDIARGNTLADEYATKYVGVIKQQLGF